MPQPKLELKRVDVSTKNAEGRTALHIATKRNMREVVHLLLRSGAEPKTLNNRGHSPLPDAARSESTIDTFKILVGLGPEVVNHRFGDPIWPTAICASAAKRQDGDGKGSA